MRSVLIRLCTIAAFVIAGCGGNVVVDSGSDPTGGACEAVCAAGPYMRDRLGTGFALLF